MVTIHQLLKGLKKARQRKLHKCRTKALVQNPQKKGICTKISTVKPKKPNSAT